ncbi:Heat shock protein beta-11 [Physocladia obscura]|uniref:Heat shock protein beta-11 n=1 Tax=Physocladia obscura TaxID=109957 RepID=A0AAD5XD16_9FUNG|nr:Heat shock protein beta-11 [Physocladia obscura]
MSLDSTSSNISHLRVSMATSADSRFPIENIIDGTSKSFWVSTGLYPQEFIISLPTLYVVKKITIWSMKVAAWTISRTGNEKKFDFDEFYSEEIEDSPDLSLQLTTFTVAYSDLSCASAAKHIKFTIQRGHNDFCAVHRVVIQGEAVPEREENIHERGTARSDTDDSDENENEERSDRGGDGEKSRNSRVVVVGGRKQK